MIGRILNSFVHNFSVDEVMKWNFTSKLLHLLILSASAADTLLPQQSIRDGESLVSANGTFELGFFNPGNSNPYVGIWYHNITIQTVVWVANRDWPLVNTSGKLTFTGEGNLMVLDGNRDVSFIFTSGSSTATTATILDTGNLVLRNAEGKILWQSFDYPTDNFLPGMLLGMVGDESRLLTSWKSSDDPSMGDFSFGANPNGTKQFFLWQQSHVYWDSGLWSGFGFRRLPNLIDYDKPNYNVSYVSMGGGHEFLTLTQVNSYSRYIRFLIDHTGLLSFLAWDDSYHAWLEYLSLPFYGCDTFNLCGSFSVCSERFQGPYCHCLTGFQQGSSADWSKGETGGGCLRRSSLQCLSGGKPDGFISVPDHVKFPANYEIKRHVGREAECVSACLNNCSCTAYAFTDICWHWYGDLATLQQLDGNANVTVGTVNVRLAASEFAGDNMKLKIIILVTALFGSLSFISIGSFVWWRRRKGREKWSQKQSILLLGAELAKRLGENGKRTPEFTLFDFSRITEATDTFSNANKLGEGGFGPVYKGKLSEGQEIAVKRLSARSGQGLEEFKNEILLIAKLQHRNLVRLLGCCIQREEKILIYEYMQNKSLDFFLFDQERGAQLDWSSRFRIIEGIAQGLIYLHKHSRLQIIHRDLKASNVLLDADMNPKISDFGLARIFNPKETVVNTNRVVGTYGHMSPEYVAEGIFSIKSDVFSFGVLLLEIVSGKRNTGHHEYKNSFNLVGYAWELWKEGKLLDLVDPLLSNTVLMNEVTRCIHVGLLCVQENAVDRPTMTDVISMFSSETPPSTDPEQPAFFTMRTSKTNLPQKTSSLNNVTVTSLDGR